MAPLIAMRSLARAEPSACEWLRRLRAGECSARELAAAHLRRTEAVNPRLNAIVECDPEAVIAAAARADARRHAGAREPLLGLPITVKDALDVAGLRATGGSFARAAHRPERDAAAVGRLRAAGAVILAKTNTPEYSASYETDNAIFGATNHPLDERRTPGGSSGGEAAAIAAGASAAGLGTDGGGSIRVPSHYCGIAGMRPSAGLVPETGNWPATRATGMMDFYCVGPLARRVEDLALLLEIIAGPDGVDPYAVPVPLGDLDDVDVASLRLAFYVDDGTVRATPATRETVEHAARLLAEHGCDVTEIEPAGLGEATELFFAAMGADGGEQMRADVAASGGRHHPQFQALLDGLPERPPSAAHAFAVRRRVFDFRARVRALVGGFDAVLCPVVAGPAPLHGEPPAGVPARDYLDYAAFNFVHTYAVAGLPAASVPAGAQDGLPIGVQVTAPPFHDHVVLAVAREIERRAGQQTTPEDR